ncbi:MAG: DUF4330 domain-containing protein [Oscillospiraceae bacterium]|jgi:hypothetical protein
MSDPKPRKKFNIIDVIVIAVILLALVFAAYKLIERRNDPSTKYVDITYTVRCPNVDKTAWESISDFEVPAQLVSGDYYVDNAYVTDCRAEEAADEVEFFYDNDGNVRSRYMGNKVNVIFTIKAKVLDTAVLQVSSQEIRIGRANYYVKTQYYELSGTILSLDVDRK